MVTETIVQDFEEGDKIAFKNTNPACAGNPAGYESVEVKFSDITIGGPPYLVSVNGNIGTVCLQSAPLTCDTFILMC